MRISINQKYYFTRDGGVVSIHSFTKSRSYNSYLETQFPYLGHKSSEDDMYAVRGRYNYSGQFYNGDNLYNKKTEHPNDIVACCSRRQYDHIRRVTTIKSKIKPLIDDELGIMPTIPMNLNTCKTIMEIGRAHV